MPKGPYIFSGSLAFTKALGRIGGMGDGVTGVLDLQFVVDLCQLFCVCIETHSCCYHFNKAASKRTDSRMSGLEFGDKAVNQELPEN
jgi:hypothetical protein